MACKDVVSFQNLMVNFKFNRPTFAENRRQPYNQATSPLYFFSLCTEIKNWKGKVFDSFIERKDGFSPKQLWELHINNSPGVEELLLPKFVWQIRWMGASPENLQDEMRITTKLLCRYWETKTVYVMWTLLRQSNSLYVVLIVICFHQKSPSRSLSELV